MVKSEFVLRGDLLIVPMGFAEPRLRAAGMAWLDMALQLFAQEVFSELSLEWFRPTVGEPKLMLSLDSSKNFRTKELQGQPDAPKEIYKRRERFDAAVEKLMARTTPEDLWAALANQRLAFIRSWDLVKAWEQRVGPDLGKSSYPRFSDSQEFLFHLVQTSSSPGHPWL